MGYDLCSETEGTFRFSFTVYPRIISLALKYGWKPKGTKMPQWHDEMYEERDDWPGIYCSNDYQVVSAEDANNMADALEQSLADISAEPVHAADEKDVIKLKCPDGTMMDGAPLGYYYDLDPVSFWGGQPQLIKDFIKFLRLGSYETW